MTKSTLTRGIVCPKCGSGEKIWGKGEVPTRTGHKRRYVCFACGSSFYKPKPVRVRGVSLKPSDAV